MRRQRGFSLLELLVVVAMIAIAAATVSLSVRDPAAAQLEREAERLIALLETARAEARAGGLPVRWQVAKGDGGDHFQFIGLPTRIVLPTRWLGEVVSVDLGAAPVLVLGPEPMIGRQQLRLRLGQQQIDIATDGLGPFEIMRAKEPA